MIIAARSESRDFNYFAASATRALEVAGPTIGRQVTRLLQARQSFVTYTNIIVIAEAIEYMKAPSMDPAPISVCHI